jgi:protein-disulfide isomerase
MKNRRTLFAGVGAAAVAVAVALILVSVLGSSGKKSSTPPADGSAVPSTPDGTGTVPGAATTTAMLAGIPQRLNELGNPHAKVTMVEFADPQCPFCREYTVNVLPSVIQSYVRTGKMKLVYSGMHFLGPDSEKALRVIYSAGLQNKAWNVIDLLYKNQGAENSGWVTDGLLQEVGNSVPGLNSARMLSQVGSTSVDNAVLATDQQSQQAGVNSTPTFFAGPTGGTLEHLNITALTFPAFKPLLDPLVK